MAAITFADELRARSDDAIARLFATRPDLIAPVPPDISALALRANSIVSLQRARENLNLWQLYLLSLAADFNDSFSLASITKSAKSEVSDEIDSLWERGLFYREDENFRISSNLKTLLGESPQLRSEKVSSTAPKVTGKKLKRTEIDRTALSNITVLLQRCEELLHHLSDQTPTALRSGGLSTKNLKEISDHLGTDENSIIFVIEICYIAGLLTIDDNQEILPTTNFDAWLLSNEEDRWHGLVTLWLASNRAPGAAGKNGAKSAAPLGPELVRASIPRVRRMMLELFHKNPEFSLTSESLDGYLHWHLPLRYQKEYADWTLREMEWLGITGQGALSGFAQALCDGKNDLGIMKVMPKPLDYILVQADNSAIAPGPLKHEIADRLGTIADIESRGGATVFRFSEASLRRGLDHGLTGDEIRDFLKRHSKTGVPQALEYLINDVARRHGKLRVGGTSSYIRCEDEGLITQILHERKLEHLKLRRIAPQVLVSDFHAEDLLPILRESGYLPAGENASGILVAQPSLRRAVAKSHRPLSSADINQPSEIIIRSAVKALRAGERSASKRGMAIPRNSSIETMKLLSEHLASQEPLAIGYADTNGGVLYRVITPLRITSGGLLASEVETGRQLELRIANITGARVPLETERLRAD